MKYSISRKGEVRIIGPKLLTARSALAMALGGLAIAGTGSVAAEKIDFQAMSWAAACVTCHGAAQAAEGSTVKSLAGMPVSEMVGKMTTFAVGDVPGSLMQQIARGYDAETLTRIAKWYEKQGEVTQ